MSQAWGSSPLSLAVASRLWMVAARRPARSEPTKSQFFLPRAIGRRNWLFADTPNGAHASAALYSVIGTAKANGHEPYRYLRFLFTELPKAQSPEAIAALLPFNIAPEELPQP